MDNSPLVEGNLIEIGENTDIKRIIPTKNKLSYYVKLKIYLILF